MQTTAVRIAVLLSYGIVVLAVFKLFSLLSSSHLQQSTIIKCHKDYLIIRNLYFVVDQFVFVTDDYTIDCSFDFNFPVSSTIPPSSNLERFNGSVGLIQDRIEDSDLVEIVGEFWRLNYSANGDHSLLLPESFIFLSNDRLQSPYIKFSTVEELKSRTILIPTAMVMRKQFMHELKPNSLKRSIVYRAASELLTGNAKLSDAYLSILLSDNSVQQERFKAIQAVQQDRVMHNQAGVYSGDSNVLDAVNDALKLANSAIIIQSVEPHETRRIARLELIITQLRARDFIPFMSPGTSLIDLCPNNTDESRRLASIMNIKYFSLNLCNNANGVDLMLITQLLQSIANDAKFLLYMPWEQLNNQLVGFKCACAVSVLFNRTLVLPPVGYKKDSGTIFDPNQFEWMQFSRYFDMELLSAGLPCRFISMDNFMALFSNQLTLEMAYFHDHGSSNTVPDQLHSYYKKQLNISIGSINTARLFHANREQLISLYGNRRTERVLALGSMFWVYDFNYPQQYPIDSYHDYLQNAGSEWDRTIYSQIMKHIWPARRLDSIAQSIVSKLKPSIDTITITIHVRRGDYAMKCKRDLLNDLPTPRHDLFHRCLPSDRDIQELLLLEFRNYTQKPLSLYISTNINIHSSTSKSTGDYDFGFFLNHLPETWRAHSLNDFFELITELDKNELALVEQLVAVYSDHFVGNMWSSFSRHISEWRSLRRTQSGETIWF